MKKYINLFIFILISLFVINAMSFSNDDKKEEVSVVKDISDFLSFEQEIIDLNNEVIKDNDVTPLSLNNFKEEKIEDDNEFKLKRLMVRGDVRETYNALKVINYQNLHIYVMRVKRKQNMLMKN